MLKKTITFKDLDGEELTEDFYFALNKAELAELALGPKGGLEAYMREIVEATDGERIINLLKKIIRMSVGRRSADGRLFIKDEETINNFMYSDAYSQLFMELVTDAGAAAAFVTGIVPSDMEASVANGQVAKDLKLPEAKKPDWYTEGRVPTADEIRGLTDPELLQEAFRRKTSQ